MRRLMARVAVMTIVGCFGAAGTGLAADMVGPSVTQTKTETYAMSPQNAAQPGAAQTTVNQNAAVQAAITAQQFAAPMQDKQVKREEMAVKTGSTLSAALADAPLGSIGVQLGADGKPVSYFYQAEDGSSVTVREIGNGVTEKIITAKDGSVTVITYRPEKPSITIQDGMNQPPVVISSVTIVNNNDGTISLVLSGTNFAGRPVTFNIPIVTKIDPNTSQFPTALAGSDVAGMKVNGIDVAKIDVTYVEGSIEAGKPKISSLVFKDKDGNVIGTIKVKNGTEELGADLWGNGFIIPKPGAVK